MVLLFVGAGVVRIGPPVNGGPVVLAPDPGGCRTAPPHSMARRTTWVQGGIGVFLLPRVPLRCALPWRQRLVFSFNGRGGFNIRPLPRRWPHSRRW